MKKLELTHARHDPLHCLVPGLFRSLLRGERKNTKLDITYDYGNGETARFVGFEPLGADDLRFLQGLIALAGPDGLLLTPDPKTDMTRQLRLFLETKFDAVEKNGMVVRERMTRLLSEIGMVDSGENIKTLKASLLRMANVTVLVTTKSKKTQSFNMLSFAFDDTDGRLFVALNPRVTEAIVGDRPHTRIELNEARQLSTDPARLIHQRLCGWIDPGKCREIALDTLCEYVWPNSTENPHTMKTRRSAARAGLVELVKTGWAVHEYGPRRFELCRPAKSPQ